MLFLEVNPRSHSDSSCDIYISVGEILPLMHYSPCKVEENANPPEGNLPDFLVHLI